MCKPVSTRLQFYRDVHLLGSAWGLAKKYVTPGACTHGVQEKSSTT